MQSEEPEFYMSADLLDGICARNEFPSLEWKWIRQKFSLNIYCKILLEVTYRGVYEKLDEVFNVILH